MCLLLFNITIIFKKGKKKKEKNGLRRKQETLGSENESLWIVKVCFDTILIEMGLI